MSLLKSVQAVTIVILQVCLDHLKMSKSLLSSAIPFCILLGAHPLLIEAHSNTVAVAGSEVTMTCQTSSGNCNNVEWRKRHPHGDMKISTNDRILNDDNKGHYSVNSSSGCNLLIKNVSLTDAGRFNCEYVKGSNTVIELSLLIVFESLPKCSAKVNVSSSEGIAAEGDEVKFTCEVRFNATESEASMTWKNPENVSVSVERGAAGRISHSIVATRPEIPSFECITTFDLPKNIAVLASNIPTGPSCTTERDITLHYQVTTATLTPPLSIYSLGSKITCSADGFPLPSYKWQIADSNGMNETWRDIGAGEAFIPSMTAEYNGTIFRCVANNIIRGKSFITFSQTFQVNDKSSDSGETSGETSINICAIAFLIGVLLTLLIVCIVLFILKQMHYVQFQRYTAQRAGAVDEAKVEYVNIGNVNTHPSPVEAAASDAKNEGDGETTYASLGEERNATQHNYASLAEIY